jgi:TPR repeat protein
MIPPFGPSKSRGLAVSLAGFLGLSYLLGQGTTVPASESRDSLRRRAEKGDADAQFNLGSKYDDGKEAPQDYTEADGGVGLQVAFFQNAL